VKDIDETLKFQNSGRVSVDIKIKSSKPDLMHSSHLAANLENLHQRLMRREKDPEIATQYVCPFKFISSEESGKKITWKIDPIKERASKTCMGTYHTCTIHLDLPMEPVGCPSALCSHKIWRLQPVPKMEKLLRECEDNLSLKYVHVGNEYNVVQMKKSRKTQVQERAAFIDVDTTKLSSSELAAVYASVKVKIEGGAHAMAQNKGVNAAKMNDAPQANTALGRNEDQIMQQDAGDAAALAHHKGGDKSLKRAEEDKLARKDKGEKNTSSKFSEKDTRKDVHGSEGARQSKSDGEIRRTNSDKPTSNRNDEAASHRDITDKTTAWPQQRSDTEHDKRRDGNAAASSSLESDAVRRVDSSEGSHFSLSSVPPSLSRETSAQTLVFPSISRDNSIRSIPPFSRENSAQGLRDERSNHDNNSSAARSNRDSGNSALEDGVYEGFLYRITQASKGWYGFIKGSHADPNATRNELAYADSRALNGGCDDDMSDRILAAGRLKARYRVRPSRQQGKTEAYDVELFDSQGELLRLRAVDTQAKSSSVGRGRFGEENEARGARGNDARANSGKESPSSARLPGSSSFSAASERDAHLSPRARDAQLPGDRASSSFDCGTHADFEGANNNHFVTFEVAMQQGGGFLGHVTFQMLPVSESDSRFAAMRQLAGLVVVDIQHLVEEAVLPDDADYR
jgi:hypothetical protein